ncbi:hypothetical protein [Streptomyces sp. NPDC001020]
MIAMVAASPSVDGTVRVIVRPRDESVVFFFGGFAAGSVPGRCVLFAFAAGRDALAFLVPVRLPVVFGVVTVHIRSWVRDFAPR